MSSSRQEIEDLLYLYAERIDLGDFEGVGDLFAHAIVVGPDGDEGPSGSEAIGAMYAQTTRCYPDDGTPHTKHVTTNAIVEVDEQAGLARCRSYFTVFQALPDFPLQPIAAGRYHDEFERVEGRWRFRKRRILPDFFGDVSRHLLIGSAS